MIYDAAVPAIKLYVGPGFDSPVSARELLCGVEEEGVPCEVELAKSDDAAGDLAFQAAEASVLGVGVAVDKEGLAAVHYNKLPREKPLFTLNYRIDGDKLRGMASNAARLVKGMPFVL
ncbi:MAG: glycerol dehydratase reactivase beta/small subunit family protein [Treponema sp.]|jgi:hypothetical protein|nr:glycerol dehydratase reactivase beta/small subunit family protein [Treponema sp.]